MLSGVFCFFEVLTEALAQVLKLPVQLLVDPEEADQVQPDQNSQLDCEDAPRGTAKSMKGEKGQQMFNKSDLFIDSINIHPIIKPLDPIINHR